MKSTLSFAILAVFAILVVSPAQGETPCEIACMKKVKRHYHKCVASNYPDRACKRDARIGYRKCGLTCYKD